VVLAALTRHRERSDAIQNPSADWLWIASAFAKASADKSAALAMTECVLISPFSN